MYQLSFKGRAGEDREINFANIVNLRPGQIK